MSDSKPFLTELEIRVKTYDIDFVGHVNNAVYVRWLEDLRLYLLDLYYPLEEMTADNISPIIINTNIHYKQGIVLNDKYVTGRMWMESLDKAAFHLAAEFVVGNAVKCTATQRGAFVDTKKMRIIRIPERMASQYRT
ncbi:thioesterase family protein [bacterium AH-315-P07]|nr:thioesterase family protein [bacterium AH-315-P07]